MSLTREFSDNAVRAVFEGYPSDIREKLLALRELVYEVADSDSRIGKLEEVLRWGEPSYLTSQTQSGSLVRMHHYASKSFDFALYFHCGTGLVDRFREQYPDQFQFGGNRSIEFMTTDCIAEEALKHCIHMALTYHVEK